MKFTRTTAEKASAPLLMIELRTIPYNDDPPQWFGVIEFCGPNTNGVYEQLDAFLQKYMNATPQEQTPVHCDRLYTCKKFRLKPSKLDENGRWGGYMNGESNIGKWTMRICDFMVDHLGEWDLIVCNSDNLDRSFQHGSGDNKYYNSVAAREMQMVFRHKKGGRGVFMSAATIKPLGRPPLQAPPYWTEQGCKSGEVGHKLVSGTTEELAWMQEILDNTFKNKAGTGSRRNPKNIEQGFRMVLDTSLLVVRKQAFQLFGVKTRSPGKTD